MMGNVLHIGYGADWEGKRLQKMMEDPSALLIDIRYKPYCDERRWTEDGLRALYGNRYRWAGKYLGNLNYKGGPIALADWKTGHAGLRRYLQEGHTLILLCGCGDYQACHRKVILERLLNESADLLTACISIKQPWAWIITHPQALITSKRKPKTIENREQDTLVRGRLLIHTGLEPDKKLFTGKGDARILTGDWQMLAREWDMPTQWKDYERGGIVGVAILTDVVKESKNPWFLGTYGYILEQATALPLASYQGSLYVFPMPSTLIYLAETHAVY
jgi:hypothetical protein